MSEAAFPTAAFTPHTAGAADPGAGRLESGEVLLLIEARMETPPPSRIGPPVETYTATVKLVRTADGRVVSTARLSHRGPRGILTGRSDLQREARRLANGIIALVQQHLSRTPSLSPGGAGADCRRIQESGGVV